MNRKMFYVLILLLCSVCAYSQQLQTSPTPSDKPEEWFRVRSENGDFSIEVPAKYSYFYDKDGITFSKDRNTYLLKEIQILNAYHENTLVSVDSYEAGKDALQDLLESDKFFSKESVASDFKRNKTHFYQLVTTKSEYHCIRQYFSTKNRIYILTAASRKGETSTMKRFLGSLVLTSEDKEIKDDKSVLFSTLKPTTINLITKKKEKEDKTDVNKKEETADKISKLIILIKPRPSYTDAARYKGVQGNIQLRIKLDENGYMPEMEIVKDLPEGLMRQAIFAALRMKFLPYEENEKPQAIRKTLVFTFTIY